MILPFPFGIREYRQRTPTTDLYILNPLRRLAELSRSASVRLRVEHLFGNVYAIGGTCIVSRTVSHEDLQRVRAKAFRQVVYVVDDDFEAGAKDPLLPDAYRARLGAFAAGPLQELKALADVVVASTPVIAALYGRKARVLQPAWARPPAQLAHFDHPRAFHIAHLGTGSHASDLGLLGDELMAVLADHPHVRLTLFAAGRSDSAGKHPRMRLRGAMPWWLYKLVVPRMRFHLAVYPLQDNRFNAARSANKFFEHALVGAASLMTPIPALRDAAGPDLKDIFVEGDAEEWRARIEADLANPDGCRDRAARTRAHILASDPLEAGARRWRGILGSDLGTG